MHGFFMGSNPHFFFSKPEIKSSLSLVFLLKKEYICL